jgi:hypothetical protein
MKTLILDYSKWRSGGCDKNKVGRGETFLRNSQGYMCCLGQFACQLDDKITKRDILNQAMPDILNIKIPALTKKSNMITTRLFLNIATRAFQEKRQE